MPIRFRCDDCSARMKVPDGSQGRRVKCPKCGIVQRVPAETAAVPVAVGAGANVHDIESTFDPERSGGEDVQDAGAARRAAADDDVNREVLAEPPAEVDTVTEAIRGSGVTPILPDPPPSVELASRTDVVQEVPSDSLPGPLSAVEASHAALPVDDAPAADAQPPAEPAFVLTSPPYPSPAVDHLHHEAAEITSHGPTAEPKTLFDQPVVLEPTAAIEFVEVPDLPKEEAPEGTFEAEPALATADVARPAVTAPPVVRPARAPEPIPLDGSAAPPEPVAPITSVRLAPRHPAAPALPERAAVAKAPPTTARAPLAGVPWVMRLTAVMCGAGTMLLAVRMLEAELGRGWVLPATMLGMSLAVIAWGVGEVAAHLIRTRR